MAKIIVGSRAWYLPATPSRSADAKMGAKILIDANLMGLDTHGIAHIDSEVSTVAK